MRLAAWLAVHLADQRVDFWADDLVEMLVVQWADQTDAKKVEMLVPWKVERWAVTKVA
jgi:hypothetical protein